MITIVTSTRNRPEKLRNSIISLFNNTYENYEIIIIDQSIDNTIKLVVKKIKNDKIRYIKKPGSGKAWAINLALQESSGEILTVLDDDCIADKNWLNNIRQSFEKNKNISGLFGRILPYKPKLHQREICPCIFLSKQKKIIDKPCVHWQNIGFGNNMAFKREIFGKVGVFKEWLGAGSLSKSAEDAEFSLRCLIKGYKLLYNPKMIVYHNRWLTEEEHRRQCLFYSCGEVACYGYFGFQGVELGKKVVRKNFKNSYEKFEKSLELIFSFNKYGLRLFFHSLREFYFLIRGLAVGWYFSKKDPL